MKLNALLAAVAMATLACVAVAQDGTPQRIRGTIDAVDGDTLTVTNREGEKATLSILVQERADRSVLGPGA